tara:strand:+ start:133 stop:276 length:144 start_codon:yes stop_codon:yes gene_type:complete
MNRRLFSSIKVTDREPKAIECRAELSLNVTSKKLGGWPGVYRLKMLW